MRTWLDHYTKSCLQDFLSETGEVETQAEVASVDAQWIDVWYEPKAEFEEERLRLGWLGRLAEKPCIFEPFAQAPDEEEVRSCLRKLLTKHHRRSLDSKKSGEGKLELPGCWIIAPTISEAMMELCGFREQAPWPAGIYKMPSIVGVGWISLRHLPRNLDTVWLRFLAGKGRMYHQAWEDINSLPEGAWQKELAMKILLARHEEVIDNLANEPEERAFMITLKERYERWEKEKLEMGRHLGRLEGIEQGIEKGIEKGREEGIEKGREVALRSALLKIYQARFGDIPAVLRQALDLEHNPDVLLGWMPLFSVEPYEKIAQALGIELSSAQ